MPCSPEPAAALSAFGGCAEPGEGITVDGPRLVFPPRAAWLTLRVHAAPGSYALQFAFAEPASLHLELVTVGGTIPLPPRPRAHHVRVVFRLAADLQAVRMMPVEDGPLTVRGFDLRAIPPWRSVLPDWPLGPVACPPRPDGAEACAVPRAPASWDERIAIVAAEAVAARGGAFRVGAAGVLDLALDPPLPAGRHRLRGRFLTPQGNDARVEPLVLVPGACRDPRDAACTLRARGGGHYAGVLTLSQDVDRLLLRPREQRGIVRVEDLAVFPAPPWHGLSLAARRRLFAGIDGLAPRQRLAVARAALSGGASAGRRARRPAASVAARRPLVSVVTPTRDGPQHLRRFLTTIARTACAEPFEIVLVDNGTTDPEALALLDQAARTSDGRVVVVRDDRPFNFAALSNRGAAVAGGDILVFANNDVAFCWPDWLDRLLAAARDPTVGVAGARLVYPDGRLQHAGVVLAGEARVRHTKRALPDDVPGAWRPVAAVTGALMALRGEVFHNLGGFRADRYPVLYNDIDLCLRAMASGAMNVLVPRAMAVHHEWATTGRTRASGGLFARGGPVWRHARSLEADRFRQDWHAMLDADPCYRTGCDPLAADFRPAVRGAGRGGGAGLSSEVER